MSFVQIVALLKDFVQSLFFSRKHVVLSTCFWTTITLKLAITPNSSRFLLPGSHFGAHMFHKCTILNNKMSVFGAQKMLVYSIISYSGRISIEHNNHWFWNSLPIQRQPLWPYLENESTHLPSFPIPQGLCTRDNLMETKKKIRFFYFLDLSFMSYVVLKCRSPRCM